MYHISIGKVVSVILGTGILDFIVIACSLESIRQGWANILFKRTQHSCVHYKRMFRSLRSFTFFIKECGVLVHSL